MKENGTKLLNTCENYKLYEITTVEGALAVPRKNNEEWGLHKREIVELYLVNEESVIYYVSKNDEPYALGYEPDNLFMDVNCKAFWSDCCFMQCIKVLGVWPKFALDLLLDESWFDKDDMKEIMVSPKLSCQYAEYVTRVPWPKAEKVIMKSPQYAYRYARDVIKNRWREAEHVIIGSEYENLYMGMVADMKSPVKKQYDVH